MRTCTSIQPKFIRSKLYYLLGLKTSRLIYVEPYFYFCDLDTLNLNIILDAIFTSKRSSQHLWTIVGCIVVSGFIDVIIIAVHGGNSKPAESKEISADTISGLK